MLKRAIAFLIFLTAFFIFSGCSTPTYDEKMGRVDFLYTHGQYREAEKELAKIAEEKAPEVVPGYEKGDGAHD